MKMTMNKEDATILWKKLEKEGKNLFDCMFSEHPIPQLTEEVTAFKMTRECFHWHAKKQNEMVDYTKQTIAELAGYAGIGPIDSVQTKGDNRFSYISTIEAGRPRINGSKDRASATYEYCAETRFMTVEANDIIYGYGKFSPKPNGEDKGERYYNAMKMKRLADMAGLARGKSDSGAEKRATIKLLKLPPATTSENNQYKMLDMIIFISKAVPNMDNKEVKSLYMQSAFGISQSIYSQQPAIPQRFDDYEDPEIVEDPEILEAKEPKKEGKKGKEEYAFTSTALEHLNTLSQNDEAKLIIDWMFKENDSHVEAIKILNDYSRTKKSNPDKLICVTNLYKLHPDIQNFLLPGSDNQELTEYLDYLIKNDIHALPKALKDCASVII